MAAKKGWNRRQFAERRFLAAFSSRNANKGDRTRQRAAVSRRVETIRGIEMLRRRPRGYDIRYSVGRTVYDGTSGVAVATSLAQADKAMYSRKRMSK